MAYVIWRVFMKKYAKMRLGIQRGLLVNPAESSPAADSGHWQKRDDSPCEDAAPERSAPRRKSGRAKRVSVYLKKCREAVKGGAEPDNGTAATSWYVEQYHVAQESQELVSEEQVADLPPPDHVEMYRARDLLCEESTPDRGCQFVEQREAVCDGDCRPGMEGAGDVLDSRTEGGTTHGQDADSTEWHDARSETPEAEAEAGGTPSPPESGVSRVVAEYLGHVYPNFEHVRHTLERQARDLLVVRFQGRLADLERNFLAPTALLAASLLSQARAQGGDAVWSAGWPLTLRRSLVLHLGELEAAPALPLRAGDCYCCVRPAPDTAEGVEAALVWRGGSGPVPVAAAMELPALLRSLLVSAERALERIPVDAAAFPCSETCGCVPRPAVRDSAMQTCPLFEVAGTLPHIDSDEEEEIHQTETTSELDGRATVSAPKSIADLPERLLMAGISLPGTHDLKGRPVILFDAQSVARSSLDRHQVATLLLYYASIPSAERLQSGFAVLVLSGASETAALEVLDQALALLSRDEHSVTVGSMVVWRPADMTCRRLPTGGVSTLSCSRVQYHVVSSEEALQMFLPEDQTPAVCGGRCDHDQLEWLEYHKELEPLTHQAHSCGRRLVAAMTDLRAGEQLQQSTSRRQLHAQQRALSRALSDPELARMRRDGAATLARLQQRSQWLPASQDVRLSLERAQRLVTEVERASLRLETLCDARRERLRDMARLRALQHETEQVLSWLCQKGEETLRRHSQLATSLPAIKEQEHDFEKFYFISMRHLDKGSDLLEECSGEGRGGGLRELARSLKSHLLGFSERLEDTRERLEDTSRCFCLLDKAYEWALETMKLVSRVKTAEVRTLEQIAQLRKLVEQYLMAHPVVPDEQFAEMLTLAQKLANDKLLDQAKVAQARCQEAATLLKEQRLRLKILRRELGEVDDDEDSLFGESDMFICNTSTSSTSSSHSGRRRSVGTFPFIYKCSHHAEGRTCSCWDPTPSDCGGATRLNGIREEERENSDDSKSDGTACSHCEHQQKQLSSGKRQLRRSCTWQYPENFEDEGVSCSEGDKSRYSGGSSTTEGSDEGPKSGEDLEDPDNAINNSKPVPPVPVNSHLHCHASNLNLKSESTKELKTQKTLMLIMREMIQTERDYVKSLEYIIENYIPELLREDIPQALRGQRNVIFGNVEKIYEFHSQNFLQELEKCENSPLLVGQCFLRHESKFYLYALYNKNKPKSDSLMSEYGTTFFKAKQLELGDKMDLASYLLKPVQRMGKYALLLQQLMKAYPDKENEVGDICAAEKMVRFQLRHGNDLLAMDSLRDCDVNVKEQGRLLRQNEFLVWQGKGKKCLRHVFLFEDLILFSKARRFPDRKNLDLYIYKNSIKMTDIGLTAKIGDSPTKFEIWFRKRKPNDTFTLQSMSEEIKKAWTEEISKLLWKQALRNREMRLAEMSSMGIGNKPCLDIRPSADQINDRSISIAQLSKTAPRFRNSISVVPGELVRSNKRPHSIISVSSSSSSAGSNSSHGTLNLAFDAADSPRLHHRSTTLHSQCSTESGIIADISLGSDDADGNHWQVERSNSSITSVSLDSSLSPTSPSEENKGNILDTRTKDQELSGLRSPDSGVGQEELSVKL